MSNLAQNIQPPDQQPTRLSVDALQPSEATDDAEVDAVGQEATRYRKHMVKKTYPQWLSTALRFVVLDIPTCAEKKPMTKWDILAARLQRHSEAQGDDMFVGVTGRVLKNQITSESARQNHNYLTDVIADGYRSQPRAFERIIMEKWPAEENTVPGQGFGPSQLPDAWTEWSDVDEQEQYLSQAQRESESESYLAPPINYAAAMGKSIHNIRTKNAESLKLVKEASKMNFTMIKGLSTQIEELACMVGKMMEQSAVQFEHLEARISQLSFQQSRMISHMQNKNATAMAPSMLAPLPPHMMPPMHPYPAQRTRPIIPTPHQHSQHLPNQSSS
ncbi:hypothetical protein BGZ94_009807 [Podila epigama]|nr:hypothetical protein BGZ94_009807 [Podila epigama]